MNVLPLNGRVIAERLPDEVKKGSLLLPNAEKQDKLKVLAVSDKSPVKVGEVIIVEKYTAQQMIHEDKEYVIIKNENIIAVIA